MYKVFVNDKPIIITSSKKKENSFPFYILANTDPLKLVAQLKKSSLKGANLFVPDLATGWPSFLKYFTVVSAGGGLVLNDKKEVLFIFRNGVWDLPKGKIEPGEQIAQTAVREVEEECGILNVKLIKPLVITYHMYFEEVLKIKKTHWFIMTSSYLAPLVPQLEEGITKAVFKDKVEIEIALKNTYKNIELVYDTFLKM